MARILFRRGTRAELDAAATAGELFANEPIFITDEEILAMGTSDSTYTDIGSITWAEIAGNQSAINLSGFNNDANFTEDAFRIINNLSEIPTQLDRIQAQQNLGLHIIDGGSFV